MVTTHAECNLTTSYVEGQVLCNSKNCAIVKMRRSVLPYNSTNLSSLDMHDEVRSQNFFAAFVNSTGVGRDATPCALEYYFTHPGMPFSLTLDWPPIYPIGNHLFAQRFTQLLNTYYLDGIDPAAITGNFSITDQASYNTKSAKGTLQTEQDVLKCHRGWLAILALVSSVMLLMGLTRTILGSRKRGPDVLDSFSLAVRNSPYVDLPDSAKVSSMDDGIEFSRKVRNVKVRLGDVCAEKEVGRIAIGMTGNGTMRLKERRLYE